MESPPDIAGLYARVEALGRAIAADAEAIAQLRAPLTGVVAWAFDGLPYPGPGAGERPMSKERAGC